MTALTENMTEEIVKQVVIATAASLIGAIVGSIFFPGLGTALGVKIAAVCGGGAS